MVESKQIVIRKETVELIEKFKFGDESYNSVISRIFTKFLIDNPVPGFITANELGDQDETKK